MAQVKIANSVAILGIGAIGGFMAAILARAGNDITCVVRKGKSLEAGINVKSNVFGNFRINTKYCSKLDSNQDIVFVATKATSLSDALESIPDSKVKNGVIIPLLNGFEHLETLRSRFGARVITATIGAIEARSEALGFVDHLSPNIPHIELFFKNVGENMGKAYEAVGMMKNVGLNVSILNSEEEVIWRKLVRLNAISVVGATEQKPLGILRDNRAHRKNLEECVKEGAAVANADGANISPKEVMRQIDRMPASLVTSLQRDIAQSLPSELDAIAGAVLRAGEKHGVACPTITIMYNALKSKN